jgi:hypothetical protein
MKKGMWGERMSLKIPTEPGRPRPGPGRHAPAPISNCSTESAGIADWLLMQRCCYAACRDGLSGHGDFAERFFNNLITPLTTIPRRGIQQDPMRQQKKGVITDFSPCLR